MVLVSSASKFVRQNTSKCVSSEIIAEQIRKWFFVFRKFMQGNKPLKLCGPQWFPIDLTVFRYWNLTNMHRSSSKANRKVLFHRKTCCGSPAVCAIKNLLAAPRSSLSLICIVLSQATIASEPLHSRWNCLFFSTP